MNKVFPWYIIRKNPLTYENMDSFLQKDYLSSHLELKEKTFLFHQEKESLVNELEKVFYRTKNPKILDIKRKIFNSKDLSQSTIPDEIKEYVSSYQELFYSIKNSKLESEKTYKLLENRQRNTLWEIFSQNEHVRLPLPLVNYNMRNNLSTYLKKSSDSHKSKERKLDGTLLKLLSRSTFKTSPFSSFTGISIKSFDDIHSSNKLNDSSYKVQLNSYLLQKIMELVSREESLFSQFEYVFPGVKTNEDGKIELLTRQDINRGKIYGNIEKSLNISLNPIFEAFLNFENSVIPYVDLLNILKKYLGDEKAVQILHQNFIKKGIVQPNVHFDEFSSKKMEDFYNELHKLEPFESKITPLIEAVKNIEHLIVLYSKAGMEERFFMYSKMISELQVIENLFNYEFVKENIIYEDFLFEDSENDFNGDEEMLKTIRSIQKLAIITSTTLQFKYEFAHKFKEKYADKQIQLHNSDVRKLYLETVELFNNWTDVLAPVMGLQSSDAIKMEQIKSEVKEYYLILKKQKGKIQFSETKIDEWFNKLRLPNNSLSSTALLQKADDGFILNKLYAGRLKLFIRYFQYVPEIYRDKRFIEYSKTLYENQYEMQEGFGFNANEHERFVHNRVVLPYSKFPEEKTNNISTRDLYFRYNELSGLVDIETESNEKIEVDYIGSLIDFMLPTSVRMFMTPVTARFDSAYFEQWNSELKNNSFILDELPRMYCGEMIIQRKKWLINPNLIFKGKDALEMHKKFIDMFIEHDIPLEFFINKRVGSHSNGFSSANRAETKPQYMNLYSPLFFKEFLKKVDNEKEIVIEELYPTPKVGEHNREYQLEVIL